jgi:hypothetical protein
VDFSDDTLKISLAPLAVTAKESNLARRQDAGDVVATLEEEPAADVDEDGTRDLMVERVFKCLTRCCRPT